MIIWVTYSIKITIFFVVLHFKNTFFFLFLLLDFTFSLSDWYWFKLISRFFDKLDCETKLLLLLLLLLEVAELAVLLLTGVLLLLLLFVLDGKDGIEVLILLNPIKLVVPYFLRSIKGVVEVKIWCCCCSSWSVAGNKTDIGVGIGNGILFDADDCGGLKKLLFHINNLEKKIVYFMNNNNNINTFLKRFYLDLYYQLYCW